jgi:hypothetical protein
MTKTSMCQLAAILIAACCLQSCQILTTGFRYSIDPTIAPSARPNVSPVELVRDPRGIDNRFAPDLVVFRPNSQTELSVFLEKYGGTIVYDGSKAPSSKPGKPTPPTGTYLIHVDVSRSPIDDLSKSMNGAKLTGKYTFGSRSGARLVALVAREAAANLKVGLDPSFYSGEVWDTSVVPEGLYGGSTLNFAAEPYATSTLNLPDGKLGIGVVRAWDYMEYKGIPFGATWTVPHIAIVDGGFALDKQTGAPLDGNLDFHEGATPVQFSVHQGDDSTKAGGENPSSCGAADADPCPWHGTEVFSVAAATPFNNFGSAGTGGLVPEVYFAKIDSTNGFEVGLGIMGSVLLEPGADVINVSVDSGDTCGDFCGYFYDTTFGSITDAVNFANGYNNAIVISIAGNAAEDNDDRLKNVPCTLDGVLCVGAIDEHGNRESYSGYGPRVAIYAPDGILVTPVPGGEGKLTIAYGTSFAAPFVAGIVSLMKALDPSLGLADVRQILQSTALPSPDPSVKPGYVNALAAVMAVSPNLPPTININYPAQGSSLPYGSYITFGSTVSDPEQPQGIAGLAVTWSSSLDGILCTGIVCDSKVLSPGLHTIIAKIVDPFGATGQASMQLTIANPALPVAYIASPGNGAVFYASQGIQMLGSGSAPNETSIPDSGLHWSSNLAGAIGVGSNLVKALPVGAQTVTLTATDAFGDSASTSVNITVKTGADYPTVRILTPPPPISGSPIGQTINFWGSGQDPVDGALTGTQLSWTDSVDGALGTGAMIHTTLSGAVCGPTSHQITLTGTNSHGLKSTATEVIYVGPIC